jgi:hypothetical protein
MCKEIACEENFENPDCKGIIYVNLVCILLFSMILLGSSMSFWNILKARKSLGYAIKKTHAHWSLEKEAETHQLDSFYTERPLTSVCSISPESNAHITSIECVDDEFSTKRNFIFALDHE